MHADPWSPAGGGPATTHEGANASRCTVFVRMPWENAPAKHRTWPGLKSGALSRGIRTKMVAAGSPFVGRSRASSSMCVNQHSSC